MIRKAWINKTSILEPSVSACEFFKRLNLSLIFDQLKIHILVII